jgi:hypothetical protein
MLRASLGKVVHTVQRAGTFAAKVSPQELHKIAVHVRAVVWSFRGGGMDRPSHTKSHPAGSLSSSQPHRQAAARVGPAL